LFFSAQKANKDVALEVLKKYTRLDDISLVQTSYDEMSGEFVPRPPKAFRPSSINSPRPDRK